MQQIASREVGFVGGWVRFVGGELGEDSARVRDAKGFILKRNSVKSVADSSHESFEVRVRGTVRRAHALPEAVRTQHYSRMRKVRTNISATTGTVQLSENSGSSLAINIRIDSFRHLSFVFAFPDR